MHILLVTASLPYPPASGGALRTYGILQGLHHAGHTVSLISFHTGGAIPAQLRAICHHIETLPPPNRTRWHRLRDLLLTRQADIARRLYSVEFAARLGALVQTETYDIVQFEGIEAACYLPELRETGTPARIVFDTFNAEAELQRVIYTIDRAEPGRWLAALYSWLQIGRIRRYEALLCQLADQVIAVSQEDAAYLRAYRADGQVAIVPSGIFVDDYTNMTEQADIGADAIVFTGKMDYRPNIDAMLWFTEHVLPQLSRANLVIVGQQPHARIRQLAQHEHIYVTGWVDAVVPYLKAAAVYVAPLRMGSGTRLKILEAMASGCAIVATELAAAGLNEASRQAIRITDTPAEFAQAVEELLHNPQERQQLAKRALQAVKAYYDWPVIIPRLLAAYERPQDDPNHA